MNTTESTTNDHETKPVRAVTGGGHPLSEKSSTETVNTSVNTNLGATQPIKSQRPINSLTSSSPTEKVNKTPNDAVANHVSQKTHNHKPVDKVKKLKREQNYGSCFLKSLIIALFVLIIIFICSMSFLFYEYYRIATTLPEIDDLRGRASKFETTRILDRNGNPLYEIIDPNAGRRTYVPLTKISPFLIAATISTEDQGFYNHPGVDFFAIVRAFWQNYQGQTTVSGASTITQQLARNLLFTPEERYEQSYQRKIREAVLATEITRKYSKDEILELYLNELNYGFLSYGIEAASEIYFGTTSDKLTLAQASFLAGLPQAPAIYDIYTNPEKTLKRHEDVLVLMYQASKEQNCIYVSNSPEKLCVDALDVTKAEDEIRNYQFRPLNIEMRYPHWVTYVRSQLESMFDPQTIYRSGFSVYTTLDPGLQDFAQNVIKEQIQTMSENHVTNGALIMIRPSTREILAMVGSSDFYDEENSGQVNMSISPRQPGSAIKPLTYIAAFEKGWTPSTLIWDVPTEFSPSGQPDDPSEPYVPQNYTGKFYGPVTVRTALANSLNIPAVKALEFVGIYDDPNTVQPDGLVNLAKRVDITTLTKEDYGLSLTLGGGDVTLLELTNFYATLANYGIQLPTVSITKIIDRNGNVIYENIPTPGEQVIRPEHAFLMSSILSDNQARSLVLGTDSLLNLPFQVAAKTGTTNDFRDNWTLGYTPDVAIGVWIGNADYSPMNNTTGLAGAGPIWSKVMQEAIQRLTGNQPSSFNQPPGIVEYKICEVSGTFPSEWCKKQISELFAHDQPPLTKENDLIQKIKVDSWTGLIASPDCSEFTKEIIVLNVNDPAGRKWIKKDPKGQKWAEEMGFENEMDFIPTRSCNVEDPRPNLGILIPSDGETITTNPLGIYVVADATEWFDWVRLDYGLGDNPKRWKVLEERRAPIKEPSLLFEWDLIDIPSGPVTLRLLMQSSKGTYIEVKLLVFLEVPTPTPTPTPTNTPEPTSTPTPTPTETLIPTEIPTLLPFETPAPTATNNFIPLITETPTPGQIP